MTNKFASTYRSLESSNYFFGSYMTNGRQRVKVLEKFICVLFAGRLSKPVIDKMPIVFGGLLAGVNSKGFDFGYSNYC